MQRSFIREILEHIGEGVISFAGGLPDDAFFPLRELKETAIVALEDPGTLQYGSSQGDLALRKAIAGAYTRRGVPTRSEEILITSGSQQALDIICRALSLQSVSVETPSYLGALRLFEMLNISADKIELDDEGIAKEGFEQSFTYTKTAYLIPDFQNPSSLRYSRSRRKQIAQIIQEQKGILIEDAPYSELYFHRFLPPISGMIPNQSYHLGSFSKSLAPGLRIGWIRASRERIDTLLAVREAMDLHSNTLAQKMIALWLERPDAHWKHLELLRHNYRAKMLRMAEALERYLPAFRFSRPGGGMFLYGTLPGVDTRALVRACIPHGVLFVPGAEFGGDPDTIRFNYTHPSPEEIDEGIRRIAEVLGKR